MKTFFCSVIFVLAATLAYAQNGSASVRYVSFFPPAHIVHSEIELNQNKDSFDYLHEIEAQSNAGDYDAKSGGLVLGAANNANVKIDNISIAGIVNLTDKFYGIRNFMVENLIEVSSKGRLGSVVVGSPCSNLESNQCSGAFLSANDVTLPIMSDYHPSVEVTLRSSKISELTGVLVNNAGTFLQGLTGDDKLKWVYLRLSGTGECRRYLVKYRGSAPADKCSPPSDLTPC